MRVFIQSLPALMVLTLIGIAALNQLSDDKNRKFFGWTLFVVLVAIAGVLANILRVSLK